MNEENGQDLPGTLSIVSTPIGNLSDLSPRAREALEKCASILCEDTRQGAKLLNAIGIRRPMGDLERLDAHVTDAKLVNFVERMLRGESLALITDAGTPGVSDPGSELVALARRAGIAVIPVPGASAVLALLAASGFGTSGFTFRGFFPRKESERVEELTRVAGSGLGGAFVWFESPQRVREALGTIARHDPNARMIAAKELTKMHERFFSGESGEVSDAVRAEIEREGPRGEWCFAVVFADLSNASDTESWMRALECLIESGVSVSESSKRVASAFDQPKKKVYDEALRLHEKKSNEGG